MKNNKGFIISTTIYGLFIVMVAIVFYTMFIISSNRSISVYNTNESKKEIEKYIPSVIPSITLSTEEESKRIKLFQKKNDNSFQEFKAEYTGTYLLEVWGAEGGTRGGTSSGGKGGYSYGEINLEEGDTLYIYIGGNGTTSQGYNGGGSAASGIYGGGATDIRYERDNLYSRIIVAGGGGSVGATNKPGGAGGGQDGVSVTQSFGTGGDGATQSSGGSGSSSSTLTTGTFGVGGAGIYSSKGYGGAGGGGWYGGAGAYPDGSLDDDRGGGGGSGYVLTDSSYKPTNYTPPSKYYLKNSGMKTGTEKFKKYDGTEQTGNSGDGYAKITLLYQPAITYLNNKIIQDKGVISDNDSIDAGLYMTSGSSSLITYFFKGDTNNNYIKFANKYFRILRINEDKSIRIIYDDDITSLKSLYSNESSYYDESSAIKIFLDTWFNNNIASNYNYSKYVIENDFCNDIMTYVEEINEDETITQVVTLDYDRVRKRMERVEDNVPTLICDGNRIYTKIGMLSADEIFITLINNNSFLKKSYEFSTMSPFDKENIYVFNTNGEIVSKSINNIISIRPVINIKNNAQYVSGKGTYKEPYIFK